MEAWEYWRNLEEFNIVQGALMAANIEPTKWHNSVEKLSDHKKPEAYEPMKLIILSAISSGKLAAKLSYYQEEYSDQDILSLYDSKISHDDLAAYLKTKGIESAFFNFKINNNFDPFNKNGSFYSPKLAAALSAREAIINEPHRLNKCTPKQAIENWLYENADKFELILNNGEINKKGISEICKVVNWKMKGGAPQLTSMYPVPVPKEVVFYDDLDSEIPF
ncbi:MAG: hypothetical protein J0L55_17530 [Caulobacterales bacterium]|nr:hypothetical protein [Caulobacterales bacterium]